MSQMSQINDYTMQESEQTINVTNIFDELNITKEIWNEFLIKYVAQYNTYRRQNASILGHREKCSQYCNGKLRELLLGYRQIHGYIALLICIIGTIGNIINIIVLTQKDMIKAPINKILRWLAVADMLVIIEYIPFAVRMYIIVPSSGEQDFRYSWAVYLLFHMHFTQIMHTISIGLTVTLAIRRYMVIIHSNRSSLNCMLSHSSEIIILPFIISPILWLPTLFVFAIKERYFAETHEIVYHVDAEGNTSLYRYNFWIHSVIIKLLPCCILTVISCTLIRVLYDTSKRRNRLKAYNNPIAGDTEPGNHRSIKYDHRIDRTTLLLVVVLILFLITEFPQGILGLLSGILQKCFFVRCYSLFGELMDLLALINAAFGFILYGLMSKQFQTSFKMIFNNKKINNIELDQMRRVATTRV